MGHAVIGKLIDNLYIIKEGKNSIEAKDYIAYMKSLEDANPIKLLSFNEIKSNVRRGLNRLIEPLLDDLKDKDSKEFSNFIAFLFLLKVKLYLDYIFKKGLDKLPIIEAISIKMKSKDIAYQIALYLKDKDPDTVLPDPYPDIILDSELFEKFFEIVKDITFRSNQYIVKRVFVDFSTKINKFIQN
jgi:hypothetical protein